MTFILLIFTTFTLLYRGTSGRHAFGTLLAAAFVGLLVDGWSGGSRVVAFVWLAAAWIMLFPNQLRTRWITQPLLSLVSGLLPRLSDTEAQALKSGSVGWDGELFKGHPDWDRLLGPSAARLSEEEMAFIDGPLEALCNLLDDWEITNEEYDLPQGVWDFIREEGFFGLVIPREHGGRGFSHTAHSEIVMKLSTRSVSAAVTVMVPNSLGPGELLLHYGTTEQKGRYLPRLARGEEVPCFALTSPVAGSDAGAIPDKGIVCRGQWQGEEVLGLRVTWNKRYITLAPVATLIGLAIKVYDPDHLVGEEEVVGVTCVLVPRDLEGVNAGARHLPMNTVFMNGPTWGNEVFIPMDQVIGGQPMLGKGWTMLLECLSIGRSISLPALATGAGKLASLTAGAYAYTREQFGRSVSQFEGVQEALEPVAGYTYQMNAARLFTAAMLDRGEHPSVPSALLKYRNTDLMRRVIDNAMDVIAGRGVITGPRNFLARAYQAVPIAITVEGANILTRSLMVFGQGAIRCHPYITDVIAAVENPDPARSLQQFDRTFYRLVANTARNGLRALALAWFGGILERAPSAGSLQTHYRQLGRFSAAFAFLTDVILLSVGGGLKARQRLSGRMADCLVHLYYASAVIRYWHDQGYPEAQRDVVDWSLQTSLRDAYGALRAAIDDFPVAALRRPLRWLVFPPGHTRPRGPNDALGRVVAVAIVEDGPLREHLTAGCFVPEDSEDAVGRLLNAYRLARRTEEIRGRVNDAIRRHDEDQVDSVPLLLGHQRAELVDWAVDSGIVAEEERELLLEALTALYDVIRVDAFDPEGLKELAEASRGRCRVIERPASEELPEKRDIA
jgi:acyl-CoA dehydrogenase